MANSVKEDNNTGQIWVDFLYWLKKKEHTDVEEIFLS